MAAIGTKRSNFIVAVTGGIGSGKTAVCENLRACGQFVVSCDDAYSELLNDDKFTAMLNENFNGVLTAEGKLDRKKLSAIVFSDKEKLNKLNELTHGPIMARVKELCKDKVLAFCEVPLLFENCFEKYFDNVIVVLRNRQERIDSVVKRSGLNYEEVLLRINSQYNYEKGEFADYFVIRNVGDLSDLKYRTEEILKKLLDKIQ